MEFRKGDKVEFILLGELKQGVVTEIKKSNFHDLYLINFGVESETVWRTQYDLSYPTPILKVPQCVADWVSHCKQKGYDLFWSIDYDDSDMPYEMYEWITSTVDNQEIFARAWLDGYEVEQEQLYYVKLVNTSTGYLNVYYDNQKTVSSKESACGYKTQFTEAEIKSMDKGEAYWLLKELVEAEAE
ncbi:DUF1642 domain-containing protein [Listeria cossartiae]|uniref:DUF1642 domain-containing protein n=1 Tax=Listeria cossartiae TaxID=2838249 RepID=UPI001E62A0C9|nr:DUF1642 domain-containing protein [Listeria cossartiae]MCD2225534.1 DUF1642 domain-containing protein [Listeria cossartiae]MCD2240285.1 DUF1642 domain-containing protein [Listeria cossartiae]